MIIKTYKSVVKGEIGVPGSKSHTIRAIAAGLLGEGISEIREPLSSEDTLSSLNAALALGGELIAQERNLWEIKGTKGKLSVPSAAIDMGNSGTGLRIFTALAATAAEKISFDGDDSLRTRPMEPLLKALSELGVEVTSANGKCPISVQGPIRGGEISIECKSSQFLTALLFATPLAPKDTIIKVKKLNEVPYIEITLDWLKRTGIKVENDDKYTVFKVFGSQSYKSFSFTVPADFSTATFPLLAAAITGGELTINNLDFNDKQGDKAVFDYFSKMGVRLVYNKDNSVTIKNTGELVGRIFDLNETPDALPAMAVAGCFANGKTILKNVPQARIKETDRIDCMTKELRKLGAKIEELEDGMIIYGGDTLRANVLEGYGDHRIIMALAIAGFAIEGETVIENADATAVTYPSFIDDFRGINANISGDN